MRAFICPGQGSQSVGMAHDIYERYPAAKELLDAVQGVVDFALLDIMFGGPEDVLTATENAQPALLAHSLAVSAVLEARDVRPGIVAGHSLGEYSALAIAGAVEPGEAVRLVRLRGILMAEAGGEVGGTMAAVIGLSHEMVEQAVSGAESGMVVVANFNAPDQTVISGEAGAVEAACENASELGAKRVIPLRVSGAFHSPLMKPAADRLAEALADIEFHDASIPVVTNVDAAPHTEAAVLKRGLVRQLTEPVLWKQSVAAMAQAGAEAFVEIGAGAVLSKMLQRANPDMVVFSTGTVADLERTAGELA